LLQIIAVNVDTEKLLRNWRRVEVVEEEGLSETPAAADADETT
jgi:hypothetical protein